MSQRKGSDLPSHWSKLQIKPGLHTLGTLKGCGFEGGISISSLLSPPLPARKIKVDSAEQLLKEKGNRRNKNLLKVSKFPSKDPKQPLTEAWEFSRWKGSMQDLILREHQLEKAGFRELALSPAYFGIFGGHYGSCVFINSKSIRNVDIHTPNFPGKGKQGLAGFREQLPLPRDPHLDTEMLFIYSCNSCSD